MNGKDTDALKCGLLGRRLGHSFSPEIHGMLAGYRYDLYEREPGELPAFFSESGLRGLNVTIPYKKDVIPFLKDLSPEAERIGAVNTVVFDDDGMHGYNTDAYGFEKLLLSSGCNIAGKKVLILGSGGASAAVRYVLNLHHADSIVISRTGKNNYSNLSQHYDAELIVNTTPVGMFPDLDGSPVGLAPFRSLKAVIDLIYNPLNTSLMLDARELGIGAFNGMTMLVYQAKRAAELFLRTSIDDAEAERIISLITESKSNLIVFKDRAGSGIQELSYMTGRETVDLTKGLPPLKELTALCGRPGSVMITNEDIMDDRQVKRLIMHNGVIVSGENAGGMLK